MPSIEIQGTTIHYEQEGSGPDLLFVHGMCGDARVWAGQIAALSGEFRCTAYDRRGPSRSPRGEAPESDATHPAPPPGRPGGARPPPRWGGGARGGARITVELLRRRPDLVRGAVLSEPPVLSIDPEAAQPFVAELVPLVEDALERQGPEAAVDAFFAFVCPGLWSGIGDDVKDRYRANASAMFAEFEAPPNRIPVDELASITKPALVMRGTDSHPTLRTIAERLARALPDARWVELEDCGHVTYAEQPEQFTAAVRAFAHEIQSPAIRS
jgi:3-oxoadipate enol-lactonase